MNTITKIMIAFALCSVSFQTILTGDKSVGQTSVNVVDQKQRVLKSQLLDIEHQSSEEEERDIRSASFIHGNQEVQNELKMNQHNPADDRTNSFITPNSELAKRLADQKDKNERYPDMRRTEEQLQVKDSKVTPTPNGQKTEEKKTKSGMITFVSLAIFTVFA